MLLLLLLLLLLRTMLLLSHWPILLSFIFYALDFLLTPLLDCCFTLTLTPTDTSTRIQKHIWLDVCVCEQSICITGMAEVCVCIVTHSRHTQICIYVYVIEIYRIDLHSADTVTPEKPHTFRSIYFIHAPHHPTHLSRVESSSGRGSAEQSRGKCIKMLCLLYFWQLST